MANSIYSRVMFCEDCYKNATPKPKSKFLLYHGDRKQLFVHVAKSLPVRGMTPHLVELKMLGDKNDVHITTCCGVCGVDIEENPNYDPYSDDPKDQYWIYYRKIKKHRMPLVSFNALIHFTDTGYQIQEMTIIKPDNDDF